MDDENQERFFRLQESEQIIKAIKPLPNLKWMFFVGWLFSTGVFWAVLIIISLPILLMVFAVAYVLVLALFLVGVTLIIPYVLASLQYNKKFYWITNKRIIAKSGLIGYKINSIPFERISDVIISRSFLERILGFGSVHIQTLAGQRSYYGRFGAEGNLQAVPDPEELQKKIFDLIKQKRESEHLTM